MENFDGTWLMIKTGDDYSSPEFIEFEDDQIIHYELEEEATNSLIKKRIPWTEKLSESKYEFVNEDRIKIYRWGRRATIRKDETITEDVEFERHYERIVPTKTALTAEQIQQLEFHAEWNNEKGPIIFNKDLDSPALQEVNKRLNKEGLKILLEELQGTYFASTYDYGSRQQLIGIKEIDEEKAILYGLPDTPYEITAQRIKDQ